MNIFCTNFESVDPILKIERRLWSMKGFAQADWAEHKAKFQQEFMLCPEWAKAESEIY